MESNIQKKHIKTKVANITVIIFLGVFLNTYVVAGLLSSQPASAQSISQNVTGNSKNIQDDNESATNKSKGGSKVVQKPPQINSTEMAKLEERIHNSFLVVLKIPEGEERSFRSTQGGVLNSTIRNLTTDIERLGGKVVGGSRGNYCFRHGG